MLDNHTRRDLGMTLGQFEAAMMPARPDQHGQPGSDPGSPRYQPPPASVDSGKRRPWTPGGRQQQHAAVSRMDEEQLYLGAERAHVDGAGCPEILDCAGERFADAGRQEDLRQGATVAAPWPLRLTAPYDR